MPIEPVKIPQNVQVEDRIIGPITLRQLILLIIGGAMSFALWNIVKNAGFVEVFSLIVAWSPLTIMAAFAFVKVNDLSLLRIIFLFIEELKKPNLRAFGPRAGVAINVHTYYRTQIKTGLSDSQTHIEEEKLDTLTKLLDEGTQNAVKDGSHDGHDENDTPRPVDRSRIHVEDQEHAKGNIDTIAEAKPAETSASKTPSSLVRDLHAPPSP